jgi:hypothetical protein
VEKPAQERVLATDDARVEVGNGHRGRTDGRLAIDLGVVALVDVGIIAAQPNAADRKSAVALALRDAGLFQEQQRAAAGPEIDELRRGRARLAVVLILHVDAPAPARRAGDVGDAMRVVNCKPRHAREIANEGASERSIVDVGAGDDPRGGHLFVGGAALHHQRDPLAEFLLVLRIFHAMPAMMRAHRRETLLEEGDILGPVHEAHVRDGMNERLRIRDRALPHQIGPELPRQIELHVDVQRLGNVDAAVASLRGVVELAIGRVAGAGVVPGVRALERRTVERLDHRDIERRLELLEKDTERGAHDAGTHEDDVRLAGGAISIIAFSDRRNDWREPSLGRKAQTYRVTSALPLKADIAPISK